MDRCFMTARLCGAPAGKKVGNVCDSRVVRYVYPLSVRHLCDHAVFYIGVPILLMAQLRTDVSLKLDLVDETLPVTHFCNMNNY